MNAPIVVGATMFAIGLLLRVSAESAEVAKLRLASHWLRVEPGADSSLDSVAMSTALERTRMVLGAAKLLRYITHLLVVPSSLLVAGELYTMYLGSAPGDAPTVWALAMGTLSAVYLAMIALQVVSTRRGTRMAESMQRRPPRWMVEEDVQPPMHVTAGWMVWDRLMLVLETLFAPLGLTRPHAQMVEYDDQVRLALAAVPTDDKESDDAIPTGAADDPDARSGEEMIRAIARLNETLVREIMRPINHVTAVRLKDYTPREFLALCRRTGYTRVPVYEDQVTNLIGYINVYQLLEDDALPPTLHPFVSKALFVPEIARVDAILHEMIGKRQQVAIVFDEFGGTCGWLSREDILEEIVGDVEDEYDRPRRKVREIGDQFLVDASLDLDDLREEVGLELPKRHCDTIAGYIYGRLGRVPRSGETIEERGWTIRVAAMNNHRIRRVRLIPPRQDIGEDSTTD